MSDYNDAREDYEIFKYCWDFGHADWLLTAMRCKDYMRLRQWDPADKAAVEKTGAPALTISKFNAIMNALSGQQLALRSDVRFAPLNKTTKDQARAMDKTYLFVAQQNSLDWVESNVFDDGALQGRGYYEVRTDFDDQMMGHINVDRRRPSEVVLDPDFCAYDPKKWPQIFTTDWSNLVDIEKMYGKAAADELEGQPQAEWMMLEDITRMRVSRSTMDESNPAKRLATIYRLINRQYYDVKLKEMFLDTRTGDMSEVPETWKRERVRMALEQIPDLTTIKRKVKTVRWRVSVNDLVLHDEDSPYSTFNIVPYFPYFIDGEPMGHAEQLIDMQNLFNKVTSQSLRILNTTANSGWIVKNGSLSTMTPEELEQRGAETGLVIEVDELGNIEKILPNSVPSGHDRFGSNVEGMMDSIGGVSDQLRGFAREDVASKAIQTNNAQSQLNFAKMFDNLYQSKRLLARLISDCVKATYTEERVLTITGGITGQDIDQMTINQMTPEGELVNDITSGEYSMTVVPSKARTTLEESEFDDLMQLREMGIAIPDAVLIESSPLSRKQEVLEAMQSDSNERDAAQAQMEEALAQAQIAAAQADVAAKEANARLADARAQKALSEAEKGDSAQIDIEQQRVDAERARDEANQRLKTLELQLQERSEQRKTALELTKVKHKTAADKMKAKAQPKKRSTAEK